MYIKKYNKYPFYNKNLAGAERYRAITTTHIRNADGAYLVYDITNYSTFENIDFWLDIIKKSSDDDIVIYLVGNKADLLYDEDKRKVSKEHAITYSKLRKFQGFGECSALRNININETFSSFYKTLYRKNKGKLEEKLKKKIIELEDLKKNHINKAKDCC